MQAFAGELPRSLRELTLCFAGCAGISDTGISPLARGLPELLCSFSIDFSDCKLGDTSLEALGRGLPRSLRVFRLKFQKNNDISDHGIAMLAENLPSTLASLAIDLFYCEKIGDAGITALAVNLPQLLEAFLLDARYCSGLGDPGIIALAQHLPASLRVFLCDLMGCLIGPKSVDSIARNLPLAMETLFFKLPFVYSLGGRSCPSLAAPQKSEGKATFTFPTPGSSEVLIISFQVAGFADGHFDCIWLETQESIMKWRQAVDTIDESSPACIVCRRQIETSANNLCCTM